MGRRLPIEGIILERFGDDYVGATLTEPGGWAYYAEIDLDRFADVDQPHCVEGARFTISDPGPELKLLKARLRRRGEIVRVDPYGDAS